MKTSYRVEAKTSKNTDSFIVGFYIADSYSDAKTKAIDSLQLKGFLVNEDILTAHRVPL